MGPGNIEERMSGLKIHRQYWDIKTKRFVALYAAIYAVCFLAILLNSFVDAGLGNVLTFACVIAAIFNELHVQKQIDNASDNVAYFDAVMATKYSMGAYPEIKDKALFESLNHE